MSLDPYAVQYASAQHVLERELRQWLEKGGTPPLFLFPPAGFEVFSQIRPFGDRLAGNDAARELLQRLNEATAQLGGVTLLMLERALDRLHIPVGRMEVADFYAFVAELGQAVEVVLESSRG